MIAFMFKSPSKLWGIAFVGAIVLTAGVSAGLAKGGLPGPAWLIAALMGALTALVATVAALRPVFVKTVQSRVDRSISRADAAWEVRERLGDAKGKFPRVSEIGGRALRYGVQRAIPLDDGPVDGLSADLPRYLPRTIDGSLRSALTARSTAGGLVILKGNSTWGKSRCMFEAVSQVLGDWRIVAPSKASEVRRLVESGLPLKRTVIWLDEMVDFLTGSDPLTRHVVQRGVDKGAIVVGTIWKDDFAALTEPPKKPLGDQPDPLEHGPGTVGELAEARSILTATYADLIEMPRDLDEEELAVASALARQDSRWAHALADAGELSPIQVLAAAPQLLHRYRSPDNEAGGVVLRAAVALLAMEHPDPIPVDLLRRVAEAAMPPTLEPDSDRWFDSALAWACRPVRGTIAPLRAYRGGAGDRPGYVAPDLLVSAARDDGELQDHVNLEQTLAYASTEACAAIGRFLSYRDDFHAAEPFLRRATERGVARDFRQYGYVLSRLDGRDDEAEKWFRKAVGAGDTASLVGLGLLLGEQDRIGESEEWLRKAVDAGYTEAMLALGFFLGRQEGRLGEAEEWYRKAADAGEDRALPSLAATVARAGRFEEAEEWFRKAVDTGDTSALRGLGMALASQEGRAGEAEMWLRKAVDTGDTSALRNLGTLLAGQEGRAREAEEWFRRAVEAGDTRAMHRLGVLLGAQEERVGEAEEWFRMAVDAGDSASLFSLGTLLRRQGRLGEAEESLRKAADAGDTKALIGLGSLLGAQEGRAGEAEDWYRKAVDAGEIDGLLFLGLLLGWQEGRADEAEEWLRKAIDAGDSGGLRALGYLLGSQEGRSAEAEEWLRKAVDAGDTEAMQGLGVLLGEQEGRADKAEE